MGSARETRTMNGMNITHVLFDNHQLGRISKEQRAGEWDVWQTSLHNPDFAEYAVLVRCTRTRISSDLI
jgi:thiamine pyrophosphate-dependent acetolactate synthase large subunit-like protein